MHSPLRHPASATTLFPSAHSADHCHDSDVSGTHNDMHPSSGQQRVSHQDAIGWPWCQSCRPFVQILLGQGMPSIAGQGSTASSLAPWALPSPFPEYVCVPALVHRSQLALFTHSAAQPLSPALSPQEQAGVAAPSTSASGGRQRKTRGVKIACTNCRLANKKCDDGRPCERCKKNGLEHSCVSAERKPRKRRQTATATMTVSTTQVSMEKSALPKDDTTTTTVHIAAGASYVDDTQEGTDATSHSSPSGSSITAGDFDSQPDTSVPPSNYALHANLWASLQSYPTPGSDAQFSNWSFDQDHTPIFGHGMSPTTTSDHHHSLSPTGLQGSNAFSFAGRHF